MVFRLVAVTALVMASLLALLLWRSVGTFEDDDLHGVRAELLLQRTARLRRDDAAYRANIRRNESFFRLRGGKFAILVTDTDEPEMVQLARRIGAQIAALQFVFADRPLSLTACVGIALYPVHGSTAEDIVARAD